jgi:hypothetical protein
MIGVNRVARFVKVFPLPPKVGGWAHRSSRSPEIGDRKRIRTIAGCRTKAREFNMIDKLCNQHRLLRAFVTEILDLVSLQAPCDQQKLAEARWRVARMLHQHLAAEERLVYRPLERDPRPEVALLAHAFRRELDDSYARYEQHLDHWTYDRIRTDWLTYRTAVRHMAAFLFARMDREEAELFPLLNAEPDIGMRTPGDRNWAADGLAVREKIAQAA